MPTFTISGRITTPAGKALPGLTVKAFDWNPRGEEKPLGKEDKTGPQGGYKITYTDADLRAGGREQGGADLIIRVYEVFEADGKNRERKLAEGALLRNAEDKTTIDVTVPLRMLRRQGRFQALRNAVKPALRARLADALEDSGESWEALRERLAEDKDFDEPTLRQLEFQHRLGEIADDHEPLAEVFRKDAKVKSLRDMALNYDRKRIRDLVRDKAKVGVPEDAEGDDDEQKAEQYADDVAERLFRYAPGAVFQRLARDKALDLDGDDAAGNLRKGVETFFNNRPDFDMRRTSVLIELEEKDALKDVPEIHREQVKERLKACQRVAALSPHEEIAAKLLRLGLDSAYLINDIPANAFVRQYAKHLGGERMAQRIHRQAQDIATRNTHTWAAMRHELKSPGTTFTHGGMGLGARAGVLESVKNNGGARSNRKLLSYETLFGSVDMCECDHCNSVYSPAAYLVDLFQYLRNNNLETDDPKRGKGRDGIAKTPLGKLFNIRPDLGELELSCENTNTILPYIDLVNEVLESYIAHLDEARKNNAKKVDIDVHDVEDETSGELLSEPRHINLEAYRILQKAVYPFTLPYDLPIDMAREYLKFLAAGRHELMRVFRTEAQPEVKPGIDAAKAQQIADQENIARGRAVDAEALGMTEEEYLIIAEEAFLSRTYYNLKDGTSLTNVQYLEKVGIRKRFEYYGFKSVPAMQAGLRFIKPAPNEQKAGFLQRAGIEYTDLVALLQTNTCNPNQLPDRARDFFNRIRFHYQQLAALVKTGETDYKKKYAPVIKFLSELKTGGRRAKKVFERKDELECWVYRYFERAGKQIVLVSESNTDSCDLSKVQMKYLDGTDLGWPEYIMFQRFIRLWHKLGWSIPELDQALTGLAKQSAGTFLFDPKEPCKPETLGAFTYAPTAEVLHQLAAVKQLLALTGIELPKLLTFWAPIGTEGEDALYKRLFIKHNLKSIDDVFEPNRFGLVLTEGEKIADHIPVLMAALGLSAGDIEVIRQHANIPDELTIETVSALYRHGLLAKALRMKIGDLPGVLDLITGKGKNMDAHPFKNADGALLFMEQYQRMVDAGFKPETLLYALFDTDDPEQAMAPDKRMVLSLAVALRQTLLQIESEHAGLPEGYPVTDDLLRSKLGLLFDQGMVENVLGFLRGALVFGDNTRSAATKKEITEAKKYYQERLKNNEDEKSAEKGKNTAFLKRVKYDAVNGLQITGILAPEDVAKVRAMFPKAKVPEKALNKILSQPLRFFEDILQAFIPLELLAGVKNTLLAPDEITPDKTGQFYRHFLPYLREQLRQRQVARLCATAVKLDEETTRLLLTDILKNAQKEPVYSEIIRLKDQDEKSGGTATAWEGYFVPAQDGHYRFILESVGKAKMSIQGKSQWDKAALTDDEGLLVHRSHRQYFQAGHAYLVTLEGYDADGAGFIPGLKWRFGDQTAEPVPAHVLYPALRTYRFGRGFERLYKAALLINGFGLDAAEVAFFQAQGGSFAQLDFNALDWKHWLHLEAYCRLRRTLPKGEPSLLDFLRWAHDPDGPEDNVMMPKETKRELAGQIARLTGWNKPDVLTLLHGERFNLGDPVHFRNGQNLFKLGEAMDLIAQTGVSPQKLFDWAHSGADFNENLRMARSIRKAAQARYQQEEWEEAVKPFSDEQRKRRRDALVAFLLVQPELIQAGVHDADSFFQYFLIDAQMDPCMETSRIKQAISSVQLFIQQCLLGLRSKQGIPADLLDEERWDWMQRYRVWEANRKVFLYPENWIEPELRDDKSPFFKELESELLQNDISKENVEKALIAYLHKVNDVARLEVVGMYQEFEKAPDKPSVLHVFGRTENAPYFYYYRRYENQTGCWTAWEKMEVDIPSYDVTNAKGAVVDNGAYLTPVVWNNRLLVFFPIFMKKAYAKKVASIKSKKYEDDDEVPMQLPEEFWEIKMGWSEYKQGNWTQKQVSNNAAADFDSAQVLNEYSFQSFSKEKKLFIDILYHRTKEDPLIWVYHLNSLYFNGSTIKISNRTPKSFITQFLPNFFHSKKVKTGIPKINNREVFNTSTEFKQLFSTQILNENDFWDNLMVLQQSDKIFLGFYKNQKVKFEIFYHPQVKEFLGELNAGRISSLMLEQKSKDEIDFKDVFQPKGIVDTPYPISDIDFGPKPSLHEQKGAYAIYNWEIFFHAVALIADSLSKSQRFEEAREWWHYIFNPGKFKGSARDVWQFRPFRETDAQNVLENFMTSLEPGQSEESITEWRENPFLPHLVARYRISAYMEWVVMRYLDNLIAWADALFRQDTIESINQATQLYVMAGQILGPRPQFVPKRGVIEPRSYMDLADQWDAFSNAMAEMELLFPYSVPVAKPTQFRGNKHSGNAYGFSTASYFCLPNNPKLLEYWDTVADRLFKIRHCLNIEGVFRKLALFEPPIDPALLVLAASQGLNIGSVLNDLNTPMPNYRFNYLLQKALELTNEVKSLGNALLSALEKKDNEVLSVLRAKHETNLHSLALRVKKLQLEEAEESLGSLYVNRKVPENRLQYYQQLVGEEVDIPGIGMDFKALEDKIEPVKEESGLKLIGFEKEDMDKASDAQKYQPSITANEIMASLLNMIPQFSLETKASAKAAPGCIGPEAGVGVGYSLGGSNFAPAAQAIARGLQHRANELSFQSAQAGKKGGFLRALQDRIHQANLAGYELMQIDRQITAQKIRIQLAQQEIANQEAQIEQAREVEAFLRDKYSNEQLYQWMAEQIKSTYYEVYKMAYDMAKKAEKIYRFEKGLTVSNFICFGYWNSARDGLLAGEQLYLSLKQLENAYIETKGHDYEISMPVSLLQLNPLALIQLKATGACEFDLPETLFDLAYPGHYKRILKSVAVTIPCLAGPYTGLNCTLRLQRHEFRKSNIAGQSYAKRMDESDERFVYNPVPVSAIAVNQGQNDSGVFELNFRDERFMPFEGAGAISGWRIELPKDFRQFDYDTISDVILHLRYTACEGGETLRRAAAEHLKTYVKEAAEWSKEEGLFLYCSLRHQFPNEWHRFTHPEGARAELLIGNLWERLPFFAKYQGVQSVNLYAIRLFAPKEAFGNNPNIQLAGADTAINLGRSAAIGELEQYAFSDIDQPISAAQKQWKLSANKLPAEPKDVWMVVQYGITIETTT